MINIFICHELELIELENNPIFINISERPTPFYVKLLLVIADAPARATLLKMSGHNSYHPCSMCELEGQYSSQFGVMTYRKPNAGNKVFYEWIERKDIEWRSILNTAQYPQKGINGPCQLSRLNYVNLTSIAPPEIMHSQFLGTMKLLIERFLFTGISSKKWYASFPDKSILKRVTRIDAKHQDIINSRLKTIKFPSGMLKTMPQLGNRFKSMDYEHLLFYGFVCFQDILQEKEFKLIQVFAYILSLLSNRYVTGSRDIKLAKKGIKAFFQLFNDIFNEEDHMYRINLHFIVHLPKMVELYGPLFVQSAYSTENTMGLIAKQVHAHKNVAQQVANKMIRLQSILSYCHGSEKEFSYAFQQQLHEYIPSLRPTLPTILEMKKSYLLTDIEQTLVPSIFRNSLIFSQERYNYQNNLICTFNYNYTKSKSTNNHTFEDTNGKFYKIAKILSVGEHVCLLCYRLSNAKMLTEDDFQFHYIYTFAKFSETLEAVDIVKLKQLCTYVSVGTNNYIFRLFNRHL